MVVVAAAAVVVVVMVAGVVVVVVDVSVVVIAIMIILEIASGHDGDGACLRFLVGGWSRSCLCGVTHSGERFQGLRVRKATDQLQQREAWQTQPLILAQPP